jgi:hypothetical protein
MVSTIRERIAFLVQSDAAGAAVAAPPVQQPLSLLPAADDSKIVREPLPEIDAIATPNSGIPYAAPKTPAPVQQRGTVSTTTHTDLAEHDRDSFHDAMEVLGLIGVLAGAIALIFPIRAIGIPTRGRAAFILPTVSAADFPICCR